jgi:hypothetical protein
MRNPIALAAALLVLGAAATEARAERYYYYYPYYGYYRNEISLGAGVQAGATGWETSGFKLFFEYARRLGPHGAIAFQVNPVVVPGVYDPDCHDGLTHCRRFFYGNGYSVDLLFGGKWRWQARSAPILGTFDLTFGMVPLFYRYHDDDGIALVGRAGGGLVILLSPHVGLRFDAHMIAGPAFLGYWRCDTCDHIEPYVAFDTGMAIEFIF